MKTIASALFAILVMTLTASAKPGLLVGMTITNRGTSVARPMIFTKSGKEVTIRSGNMDYAITPTLLANGFVEVSVGVREHVGDVIKDIVKPRITAKLDQRVIVQIGDLAFESTTSLAQ